MKRKTNIYLALLLFLTLIIGCAASTKNTEAEEKKPTVTNNAVKTKKASDSWIDSPATRVGGKAVFTDCRAQENDIPGPPIFKKQAMPAPAGANNQKLEKTASRESVSVIAEVSADAESGKPVDTTIAQQETPKQKENYIYLSNDDSMSLSSPQRIEYAIKHFLPIPAQHIRPHEFLNYYKFDRLPVKNGEVFSVKADLANGLMRNQSTLALSVQGKTISKENRENAVITFVVDQSGSMSSDNRMTYLKKGLTRVYDELKDGDVINVVQFNHRVCTPLEGFVVGRDDKAMFDKTIDYLGANGSTNLHDGLVSGYELSNKYYDKKKNNRVIMITDAMANTGVVNSQLSATVTKHYDEKEIAFSGIGVGHGFNDHMLNELTEKGKGAYLFLSSESAVDKVFGDKFISLLEVVARNVHFKLTMPKSIKMDVFYGEESSTVKEEVQAIHYFANSSQLFLSDLKGEPKGNELFKLDLEYTDPANEKSAVQHFEWKTKDIFKKQSATIVKARLILLFTDLLAETNQNTCDYWSCMVYPCFRHDYKPVMQGTPRKMYGVDMDRALKTCEHYKKKMSETAQSIKDDEEVQYLLDLQKQYCARFENTNKRRQR